MAELVFPFICCGAKRDCARIRRVGGGGQMQLSRVVFVIDWKGGHYTLHTYIHKGGHYTFFFLE